MSVSYWTIKWQRAYWKTYIYVRMHLSMKNLWGTISILLQCFSWKPFVLFVSRIWCRVQFGQSDEFCKDYYAWSAGTVDHQLIEEIKEYFLRKGYPPAVVRGVKLLKGYAPSLAVVIWCWPIAIMWLISVSNKVTFMKHFYDTVLSILRLSWSYTVLSKRKLFCH